MITRTRKIGKFGGTHIIVQNQIMKDIFTDTGFANINQVSVKGCLRMDELFEKVKKEILKRIKQSPYFLSLHINGPENFLIVYL